MASVSRLGGLLSNLSLAPTTRPIMATKPTSAAAMALPRATTAAAAAAATAVNRPFHTTTPAAAPGGGSGKAGKKRKKGGVEKDARIVNLKQSMPRAVPAPLRFARNRALRHWTIHRAWHLWQRRERERRSLELERMSNSMWAAAEELRATSGPGSRPEGYLYRVSQEKKGLYGHDGVPIEYARAQTETPAREAWHHGWTRP